MQDAADKEERYELWKVILDVRTTAGPFGGEGEGYAMEMSNLHLVQRLESRDFIDRTGV